MKALHLREEQGEHGFRPRKTGAFYVTARPAASQVEAGQGELPLEPPDPPALTQQHDLIRNLAEYAAFFARGAQRQSTTGEPTS